MKEPSPAAHGDFAPRLLGSLSWTAGAQIATQVVTFLAGVLLARLLMPADFGLVGIALAYLAFLWLLGQVGFNSAIIYSQDLSEDDLCTMYWTNLGLQVLLLGVAIALAPLAAALFHDPRVVPVIRAGSLTLLATGLGGVQKALLEKRLEFRCLARNQFTGSVAYAVVAVSLALSGFGVWALVFGRLVGDFAEYLLAALSAGWRPRPSFSRASLSEMLGYGSRVWAGNVLYYGQENIDNVVVGAALGTTALGFYSLAFRLANAARYVFTGVVARVMFPSFSSGREQPHLLRQAFLRIDSYSLLLALGLCGGLALVAPEFVSVVYGPKWIPAVSPLRVLAVAAGLYCAAQVTGPVLLSMGMPGLHARLAAVSTGVLAAGVLAGSRFGITGVAIGVLASVVVAFALGQYFASRALGIDGATYRATVTPPLLAVASMVLTVSAWRWVGQGLLGLGEAAWLLLAGGLGGVALAAGAVAADPERLRDISYLWNTFREGQASGPGAAGGRRTLYRRPDEAGWRLDPSRSAGRR